MSRHFANLLTVPFGVIVVSIVVFAFTPARAWVEKEEDEDDSVHELMEKVHEGKKSPWKVAQRVVSKDPIDWAALGTALPPLGAMSKALATTKNKEVRESADGYIEAFKDLTAQIKKRDAAGTRAAIKTLASTCTNCHYKGGPGGKLED